MPGRSGPHRMNVSSHDESEAIPPDFEESFRQLFHAQYASLFRYLHRLTGDADAAEDDGAVGRASEIEEAAGEGEGGNVPNN